MKGAFWLVGILLLAGMFVGAKMLFDQSSAEANQRQIEAEAAKPQDKIVCWGNFEGERGVAMLYPSQFGKIMYLAPENTPLKAGDVLLQIEDTLAKQKVEEAKVGVKVAELQATEARQLTRFYELQKQQQGFAIDAIKNEVKKLDKERETKLSSVEKGQAIYKTIVDLYDYGQSQLADKKKAEEAKLEQLKLQDANLKIAQAEADVQAKKIQLEMAQEVLKHFKIVAPSDGSVLRVYVHNGEILGPSPRVQALDFLPDAPIIVKAEVLQEWGHYVKVGQNVEIEDDTYKGPIWEGTVRSISKWYAPIRSPIIEPFRFNDVRTLECIIEVTKGDAPKFIGQRVRAKIKLNPDKAP